MPQMRAKMLGKEGKKGTSVTVENVVGEMDIESLSRLLEEKCDAGVIRIDASSQYSTFQLWLGMYILRLINGQLALSRLQMSRSRES